MLIIDKYDNEDEFLNQLHCKCENVFCTATLVDTALVVAYARLTTKVPNMLITSGYRCPAHNASKELGGVGGAPKSKHLAGQAVDVQIFDDFGEVMNLTDSQTFEFLGWAKWAGFTFQKVYSTHFHLDVR